MKKWTIEVVETYRGPRVRVSDGWFCDWPIRYHRDGQVVFDFPERIPVRIRRQAARFLAQAEEAK